jgi:hypothetical protein
MVLTGNAATTKLSREKSGTFRVCPFKIFTTTYRGDSKTAHRNMEWLKFFMDRGTRANLHVSRDPSRVRETTVENRPSRPIFNLAPSPFATTECRTPRGLQIAPFGRDLLTPSRLRADRATPRLADEARRSR